MARALCARLANAPTHLTIRTACTGIDRSRKQMQAREGEGVKGVAG